MHLGRIAAARGAAREQLDRSVERERGELHHRLAVDAERELAGREDPQPGRGGEQPRRQRRRGADDVLAVVQDEHGVGAAQALEQRALAARDRQLRDHHVEDLVGGVRAVQPGQPDAAGHRRQSTRRRDRQRRLADAAGADDLDEPLPSEPRRERGDLVVAPDELDRQRRQVAGRPRAQRAVVVEHLALELAQARTGLQAEVVRQAGAQALVGRQRVGLAARAVERHDQQLPQALAVRGGRDRRLQVGGRHVAEPQPRRELGLQQRPACLLKPAPVGRGPVAGRRQDVAAKAAERRRAQLGGGAVVAGPQGLSRGRGVAHEPQRVDRVRRDLQPVAALDCGDRRRVAERPAQPRDLRLQRVAPGRHPGPQVVDQRVGAHRRPGVEREAYEQLRGLAAGHR